MPNTQLMLFGILVGAAIVVTVAAQAVHIWAVSAVLAILALLVALAAFLTKDYVYLLDAVRNRKGNTLVLGSEEAFVLTPSGNALIRRENGSVYASCFVRIPIYRSATEMSNEEKIELSKLFGRVLTLSKEPIRLSAQLYMINKDKYIERLRNMLNESEEKYRGMQSISGGERQQEMIDRIRGEVTMWRNLLENVSKSRSQVLVLYAMASAIGGTDEEAATLAYNQAEDLAGGISATLGVNATVVTGNDMLAFVEPDFMIPMETVSERLREKTMEGA